MKIYRSVFPLQKGCADVLTHFLNEVDGFSIINLISILLHIFNKNKFSFLHNLPLIVFFAKYSNFGAVIGKSILLEGFYLTSSLPHRLLKGLCRKQSFLFLYYIQVGTSF